MTDVFKPILNNFQIWLILKFILKHNSVTYTAQLPPINFKLNGEIEEAKLCCQQEMTSCLQASLRKHMEEIALQLSPSYSHMKTRPGMVWMKPQKAASLISHQLYSQAEIYRRALPTNHKHLTLDTLHCSYEEWRQWQNLEISSSLHM